MVHKGYLTMEQINILLKCYYLRKYSRVADDEGLTADKVRRLKENGLRTIRLAYSKQKTVISPRSDSENNVPLRNIDNYQKTWV